MRVSPVGFAFDSIEQVMTHARLTAEVTHNHPEGIRGAQATAVAILLARMQYSKSQMKEYLEGEFGYNLSRALDDIRVDYEFDVSCEGTVPPSIIAFLESTDYEDAVRNAISLGGDSDTMACIAGGIAEAYYGEVPIHIVTQTLERLDPRLNKIVSDFSNRFGNRRIN
jgi:ADP-ribosylglycohydrolase